MATHAARPLLVCPLAGLPADTDGAAKYRTLHAEHAAAVEMLNAQVEHGPYLDDCYPIDAPPTVLAAWLRPHLARAAEVWMPLGIHHPDHLRVSDACLQALPARAKVRFYEELPYRVLYPQATDARLSLLAARFDLRLDGYAPALATKRELVACYASQLNEDLERCLFVPERMWVVT